MQRLRYFFLLGIVLWLGLMVVRFSFSANAPDDKFVRVAILKNVDHVTITIRGKYQIIDPISKEVLFEKRRLPLTEIVATISGIKVGAQEYLQKKIRFYSDKDITVRVNGKDRRYREIIDIIQEKNKKFLVVNVLPLEEYIRGILYHEAPHRCPLETLNAQAVAARTYALYRMKMDRNQPYDVTSDIYSQVYGGRSSERYRANIAVAHTKSEVLIYNNEILPAYFSATCGGHTEDVSELWKQDLPPLKGVPCDFCKISPHYRWKRNFRSQDVQEKLNQNGYHLGLIKDIKVLEKNVSGRVRTLEITTHDGESVKIAGKDFRRILGPNLLKSNRYDVVMQGYYFDILGQGWGHGVGMCQWGALGMAQQRYKYKEILQYYYPGTQIVDYHTVSSTASTLPKNSGSLSNSN